MAATAYASLVSLLNTLDAIHTHPLVSTFFDINQNKSLSEKVNFFVDFVEKFSDADSREVEDLVRRIGDAAHEAEDMIEVYAADRVRGLGERLSLLPDLQTVIEEMELIKEEVIKVKEETGKSPSFLSHLPLSSLSSSSSSTAPSATDEATTMVGFGDNKHKLLDELLGHDVDRQIISITGMGGIGKTTLARNSYENSLVVHRFNVRAWITVSQDSSATKVFLQALSCLGVNTDIVDDQQLSVKLHQTLYNRRYLIILDDVWSVEIWNQIKLFFPENKNGSRIVVTTRDSKLIDCIGSSALPLKFLDEENSWKLFCDKAFPQKGFVPELEKVGKKIVKKCGGLPLAVSVIGGLLGKSPSSQGYWKRVAEDRSLILNLAENKPSDILYLSYKYLPVCLKPCFLYLGLYPEDSRIDVAKLIKLWIAEGFIKAKRDQSLEDVAETYINELVDRNLLLLHPYRISNRAKTCSTHDLVRDLCIKIGEEENFYYVPRSIDGNRHFIADQTKARFCFQESNMPSIFNPIIVPQESRATTFKTRLLRVLYCGRESPYDDALQEVNMRYSEYLSSNELVPSLLSRLWSLQTLIVTSIGGFKPPVEIWEMPQLRHIHMQRKSLPDPPPVSDDGICVLQNLQTLRTIKNLIFTEEVCKRIPNIKLLYIRYDDDQPRGTLPSYHLENIGCFNKLESLALHCYMQRVFLPNIKFPNSLKELTLEGSNLEWDYMSVIASLPHLQSLDIVFNAIAAIEWVFTDEKFASLKYLILFHCHVTKWIAQSSNFPVLEKLSASGLKQLDEIPSGIGEITTLRLIHLSCCSESANISAVEILHEQQRFGNFGLQVEIKTGGRANEREKLREKIQELELIHAEIL